VLDRPHTSAAAPSAGDRVTALVGALFAKRGIARPVARDEDLSEAGLSSLDMVNLMLAVEGEFGIKIADADMTPANFRTVARIESLLARSKGE